MKSKQQLKIAVVTGAASGIGLACAQTLATAGYRVVISDKCLKTVKAVAASLGEEHLGLAIDISDAASIVAGMDAIASQFARVDVLVNNAGIIDKNRTPALEKSTGDYEDVMRVNLDGSYLMAKEVYSRFMLPQSSGSIVNVCSVIALMSIPGRTIYTMSKGALMGLTPAMACEFGTASIRVNSVLPGYVRTAIVDDLTRSNSIDPDKIVARVPLGRMADPDEIAEAILWSAENTYLSGASIIVDGGYHAFGGSERASIAPVTRTTNTINPVVVVIGGASGIGQAVVETYLKNDARVIVIDINKFANISPNGFVVPNHQIDITDQIAVDRVFTSVAETFGHIDVLVNCAAIADAFEPTHKQSYESFQRTMAVNLQSSFECAKAGAQLMKDNGGGAIVNIASIAGLTGLPTRNSYCASKSGIISMTRSLACEWAEFGIRVNCVAPGYVNTPAVRALEEAKLRDLEQVRKRTPLKRLAEPQEIVDAIVFLGSSRASYFTGSVLPVDGGWTAFGDCFDE